MAVTLSDGLPCEVRRLGLYELDFVTDELPDRVFYYEMGILGGQTVKAPYQFPAEPPQPPDMPLEECQPNSREWRQWQNVQTYEAAIAHLHTWTVAFEKWRNDRDDYILRTCVNEADWQHVKTPEDWKKILAAAVVPELTMEALERQALTIFQSDVGRVAHPGYIVQLPGGWRGQHGDSEKMGAGNYRQAGLAGVAMGAT